MHYKLAAVLLAYAGTVQETRFSPSKEAEVRVSGPQPSWRGPLAPQAACNSCPEGQSVIPEHTEISSSLSVSVLL